MGLVNSALQIGRSALLAYQGGLQVISNNIGNLGSESYVRQSADITPMPGVFKNGNYDPGAGVTLAEVRRNVDEALNTRLRMALAEQNGTEAQYRALTQLEATFNSLSDTDLSSMMNEFFNAWSDLQNTPEDLGMRGIVLAQGESLAESFRRTSGYLLNQHEALNDEIEQSVGRLNEIASDLASINVEIATDEATARRPVSMLRDQRDALLEELSALAAIQVHEQPDGCVNVYIANEPLIQRGTYRELTTTREIVDDRQTAVVRWEDNHKQITPWGGTLEGQVTARDTYVVGQLEKLDELAGALIADVNRVHASGQGLQGYATITGSVDLLDTAVALNTADNGLTYLPTNGSFTITANAGTVDEKTIRIDVDLDGIGADTTLTTLANNITATAAAEGMSLTAVVTPDNRLRIDAGAGDTFVLGDDTSGVLGALGINNFFDGKDATDIALESRLVGQPLLVGAGTSSLPGDGSNAGRIAALATEASGTLKTGQSLLERYTSVMTDLASTTSATKNAVDAAGVVSGSLQAQWESVSGVNLDEETLTLMKYQRAFQGAARVVSTVDELIAQVLAMTR